MSQDTPLEDRIHLSPPEMEALALRWGRLPQSERDHFWDRMNRQQRKRLERTIEKLSENRALFDQKLTTRQDVVQIIALYIDRNLLPMARRLDELERREAFRALPFYRRWKVHAMAVLASWWDKFEAVLDRFGITLIDMRSKDGRDAGNPGENPDAGLDSGSGDDRAGVQPHGEGDAPGDPAGERGGEVRDEAARDGVHASAGPAHRLRPAGDRPGERRGVPGSEDVAGGGVIEVVSR